VLIADVSEHSIGSIFKGRHFIDLPLKMEPIVCSKTLTISTQTPGKHPKENILHFIDLPLKMEPIECSETSAISTQTPGKHPKENILHLTHGRSLKSTKQFKNT
jgi:hypothetical protein